jgi:hypothetical protein
LLTNRFYVDSTTPSSYWTKRNKISQDRTLFLAYLMVLLLFLAYIKFIGLFFTRLNYACLFVLKVDFALILRHFLRDLLLEQVWSIFEQEGSNQLNHRQCHHDTIIAYFLWNRCRRTTIVTRTRRSVANK